MPEFLKLQPPFIALEEFPIRHPPFTAGIRKINTIDAIEYGCWRKISSHLIPCQNSPAALWMDMRSSAAHTHGSSESLPAILKMIGEAPMGKPPAMTVGEGQAILIHTGGMIPDRGRRSGHAGK